MCSIKAIVFLLVSTLFVIEVEAKSRGSESAIRPGTGTGKPRSSLSGIGDDYWFWAYHFSDHDWKDTPMSMQEFAEQNVRIMWQNRPANASATACLQGEWSVTNYDKVSPAMRSAYFTRGGFWSSFSKKVRFFDCFYLFAPNQTLIPARKKMDVDHMAYAFGEHEKKCLFDPATWHINCP